ncbi:MAG: APC family permease [Thermodesulfobacteriota bacterium]|nr:APC family permease [Thermodesulfobacteriota bacterium]
MENDPFVKLNRMRFASLIAVATGLMLSSESLALLGNNAGVAGMSFLIFIPAAILLHLVTAFSLGEIMSPFPGPEAEARFIRMALGPVFAIVFPIGARVLFTVCAATGILATAGYVFNETFLFWFPNLGFSFCLLGILVLINLLGSKFSKTAQIMFVSVAILGLLVLSIGGLSGWENVPSVAENANPPFFQIARAALFAPVIFLGYDLAGMTIERTRRHPFALVKAMVGGLLLVGLIFYLWGVVSLKYVSPGKLADTTIPYTITAKAIMGEKGRIFMGIVILSGTCAAVNALFMAVSRMIAGMSTQGLLPSLLGPARNGAPIPLIFLGIWTGAMMAVGMAGEPALAVYTRAGMWLWLFNYAVIHLCVFIMSRRMPEKSKHIQIRGYRVFPIVAFAVLIMILVGLLWTDDESILLIKSIFLIVAGLSFYGLLWIRFSGKVTGLSK